MIKYNRLVLSGRYYVIEIFECPIDVILFAASLGEKNVTVENFKHNRNPDALTLRVNNDHSIIEPKMKRFEADFQISNSDFISLKGIWETQGCYAVFHNSDELKFKATDLNESSRYKALDNFKWNLEIAIPDSASDGLGQMVSPDSDIIEKIENYILSLNNSKKADA